MASTSYNALNGREIREIAINRITKSINELKYMREGNSFHNVNVQIGILITAFPAEVPVPNLDEEFEIISKSFNETKEAAEQIETAEKFAEVIDLLAKQIQDAKILRDELIEKRSTIVYESELDPSFNGFVPDKTRMENDMPISIEKMEHGKRVETKISPLEFKKMVKQ